MIGTPNNPSRVQNVPRGAPKINKTPKIVLVLKSENKQNRYYQLKQFAPYLAAISSLESNLCQLGRPTVRRGIDIISCDQQFKKWPCMFASFLKYNLSRSSKLFIGLLMFDN